MSVREREREKQKYTGRKKESHREGGSEEKLEGMRARETASKSKRKQGGRERESDDESERE